MEAIRTMKASSIHLRYSLYKWKDPEMFSKRTVQELGKVFQLFYFLRLSPFIFNPHDFSVRSTASISHLLIFNGNVLYSCVYSGNILVSLVQEYYKLDSNYTTTNLSLHLSWLSAFVSLSALQVTTAWKRKELAECITQYLKADGDLSGKWFWLKTLYTKVNVPA